MSEYHKIETLYERDQTTGKVNPGILKNRTYGMIKTFVWTEKVDGSNVRVEWDPGNAECQLAFAGRSNEPKFPDELMRWLHARIKPTTLSAVFPSAPATIYLEGFGAGIRKGGGYGPEKTAIVFDVLVDNKWWLSDENMRDVASKLGLEAVPSFGDMPLDQATDFVRAGFVSRVGLCPKAEGLVGRPIETLFDKKGARIIVKLKTKDF